MTTNQTRKPSLATCDTFGEKVFHLATLFVMAAIPATAIVLCFLGIL